MCMSLSTPSISKATVMDMSYFVYEDDFCIIIPYATPTYYGIGAIFEPFHKNVG